MMPNLQYPDGTMIISPDGDKAVRTDHGQRPERGLPNPVRGDDQLYDMVDPSTGIDQGGNPLMEGTLAQDDNGWQPYQKRDETYASKESPVDQKISFVIDRSGHVYAASGNQAFDQMNDQYGINPDTSTQGQIPTPGAPAQIIPGQDNSGHTPETLTQMLQQLIPGAHLDPSAQVGAPAQIPPYTSPHQVSTPGRAYGNQDPYSMIFERHASEDLPKELSDSELKRLAAFLAPLALPALEDAPSLIAGGLIRHGIGSLLGGAMGGSQNASVPIENDQSTQTLGAIDRGLTNDGYHESPDGDTHQYSDGDISPDQQNPNLDETGGATKGEDETHTSGFSDDSPGIRRAKELLEKILHFYHSDESGSTDPDLRELDSQLENENPGYKDKKNPDAVHQIMLVLKSPKGLSDHQMSDKKAAVTSDNHQGPVTDVQKAAVADLLQKTNREAEISTMLQEPWGYAKELAEVTGQPAPPNNVDPSEQTPLPPQPAQEEAPPQMPVPDPMQPGQMAPLSHKWALKTSNPLAIPAADQVNQQAGLGQVDTSGNFVDTTGAPLELGQIYEIHNPSYAIPDLNRVVGLKPTSIKVENVGQFSNNPSFNGQVPQVTHEIDDIEVRMNGLTFKPYDSSKNSFDPAQVQASTQDREWINSPDPEQKTAGAKFSPQEQREFIDEKGKARNSDKLDLSNTHYERESRTDASIDDAFLW